MTNLEIRTDPQYPTLLMIVYQGIILGEGDTAQEAVGDAVRYCHVLGMTHLLPDVRALAPNVGGPL